MAYQEGLAGIDACLDDFMTSLKKLQQDLRMEETRGRFTACEQAIERLTSQVEACAQSFAVIHHHQKGLSQSFAKIEELRAAMQLFEQAMGRYQQQAGNLNRKLYNRDFQATLKSMNELAADSRSQGTYAYRHLTDHDYEILMHEYQTAFGSLLPSNEQNKSHGGDAAEHTRDEAQDEAEPANARKNVRAFLQAAYQLLEETSLTQQEYEGLQRLIEKLVHSHHEARSRFLAAYQSDTGTD
ncbi:hypothetical protein [Mitsuokella sp. AF33-22]|uniref:hypothetical protein n=1 Tax=Mitsuokella sp. AF33-22 TaxID=2292047 RepID=UPI0011C373CF|nr:hypothetical protein [Mitsuokella sp. AF33-22]